MSTPHPQGSTVEELLQANTGSLLQALQRAIQGTPPALSAPPQPQVNPFPVAGTPVGPTVPQLFPYHLPPHCGAGGALPPWQQPMPPMPYPVPGGCGSFGGRSLVDALAVSQSSAR